MDLFHTIGRALVIGVLRERRARGSPVHDMGEQIPLSQPEEVLQR